MRRLILILLVLITGVFVLGFGTVSAQGAVLRIDLFDQNNCSSQMVIRGAGFTPGATLTAQINGNVSCGSSISFTGSAPPINLGVVSGNGSFIFGSNDPNHVLIVPGGVYTVFVSDSSGNSAFKQVFVNNLGTITQPAPVPQPQPASCGFENLCVGATARVPLDFPGVVEMTMNPFNGSVVYRRLSAGAEVRIVEGPVRAANTNWWRLHFLCPPGGVPCETTGWASEFSLVGLEARRQIEFVDAQINSPVYLDLTGHGPSASVVPWMNSRLNMRSAAIINEDHRDNLVGQFPINTIANVLGQNENGTFLFIQLPDGTTGWVCEHLTHNNGPFNVIPGSGTRQCNSSNLQ